MTKEGEDWAIHHLGAQFGLAAVAESKGDAEGAKAAYTKAKEIAESKGFQLWVEIADERLATVDQMIVPLELISKASLPKEPEPEAELPAETPAIDTPSTEGETPDANADEPSADDQPAEDPGADDGSGG